MTKNFQKYEHNGLHKIVSKKILIVAFLGTLTISFFIGSMSSSDTQACLTLYIQLEPDAFDERNNKGDKLQSDFFKKSVHNNIICTLNNITNLRELFQTRKFWLPSFRDLRPNSRNSLSIFHIILINFYSVPVVRLHEDTGDPDRSF